MFAVRVAVKMRVAVAVVMFAVVMRVSHANTNASCRDDDGNRHHRDQKFH